MRGSGLRSCSSDHAFRKYDSTFQTRKYNAARARKNGVFKYSCLWRNTSSCATRSGLVHGYSRDMPSAVGGGAREPPEPCGARREETPPSSPAAREPLRRSVGG